MQIKVQHNIKTLSKQTHARQFPTRPISQRLHSIHSQADQLVTLSKKMLFFLTAFGSAEKMAATIEVPIATVSGLSQRAPFLPTANRTVIYFHLIAGAEKFQLEFLTHTNQIPGSQFLQNSEAEYGESHVSFGVQAASRLFNCSR